MRHLAGILLGLLVFFPAQAMTPWMRAHPEVSWKYLEVWEKKHQWLTPRREGRIKFQQDNLAEAEVLLAQARADGAVDGEMLYELAYCKEQAGNESEAFALWGEAAQWFSEHDPKHNYNFNSRYRRARYLEELGQGPEALKEYELALDLAASDDILLLRMAGLQFDQGKYREALELLAQVKPNSEASRLGQELSATIYLKLGEMDQATQALKRAGNTTQALYLRGKLAWRKGDLQLAQGFFSRALAAKPDSKVARVALANIAYELDDLNGARRRFEDLASLEPKQARWQFNLGIILRELGEKDQAANAFKKANSLDPDLDVSTALSPDIGVPNLKINQDPASAEQLCRRQLEENPFYYPARFNLALSLQKQGKNGAAIIQYKRLIRAQPEDAPAHLNLGLLYLERDEKAKAARRFKRYLQLDPESEQAELVRHQLRRLRGW